MLAIVLARTNSKEYDQAISLYTREQGRLELLAKGIKKITSKNSSTLEQLACVDIEIAHGKEITYVTKAQPSVLFKQIYADFEKITLASYAALLVNEQVLVGEKDQRIFDLLFSFLEFVNSAEKIKSLNIATSFILKLCYYLGFSMPEHDRWLKGSWADINTASTDVAQARHVYERVLVFAQNHSAKKLANFFEHDRIM